MTRASGKIIYRDHWKSHLVEIIEHGDTRSLYFAGDVLQSTMSISAPHRLVLSYTRFMMATLLFMNPPHRVLVIGVGAGSLIRFIHHHFPMLHHRRGRFFLAYSSSWPKGISTCHTQAPSASIAETDMNFLAGQCEGQPYDLMLIDAFDQDGMAPSVYSADFFGHCLSHLGGTWHCQPESCGAVTKTEWTGYRQI